MSQKRKAKRRGSKDEDEKNSAAASSKRSSTYFCDVCSEMLDEKQVACVFQRNSDRHCYCKKCFKDIFEESKEKRAKDEEKDASMKKNNAGMDYCD